MPIHSIWSPTQELRLPEGCVCIVRANGAVVRNSPPEGVDILMLIVKSVDLVELDNEVTHPETGVTEHFLPFSEVDA